MKTQIGRRGALAGIAGATALGALAPRAADAQQPILLRLSGPMTPTDARSKALEDVFAPAVKGFATYQPHYNSTLFKQGTELEAIARGNLEMSITSAQELATIMPAWSIFTAGYLLRDAEHQKKVFASPIMDGLKKQAEDKLGVKLLSVMYLGRRQLNLRGDKEIRTPADLAGLKLRMPATEAWLFLGTALGGNPVPVAFTEIYTALQTGAIDAQDNPLPTNRDSKFYEVTKQIVLTSHLVDQNYIAFSKRVWDKLTADQGGADPRDRPPQAGGGDARPPADPRPAAHRPEGGRRSGRVRPSGPAEARGRTRELLQGARHEGLCSGCRRVPDTRPEDVSRIQVREGLAGRHGRPDQRDQVTRRGRRRIAVAGRLPTIARTR